MPISPLNPRNQQDLAERHRIENALDPEVIEREPFLSPGTGMFHTKTQRGIRDFFHIIARSQRDLIEIAWILAEEGEEPIVDESKMQRVQHPMVSQLWESHEALSVFLTSIVEDKSIVGFIYQKGQPFLSVIKGERKSGQKGHVFLSYTNMSAYY